MTFSVLVGPNVEETTTLTESEYQTLKNALRLARAWERGQGLGEDDREANAIASALRDCDETMCRAYRGTLRAFLRFLMVARGEHADEIRAMLVDPSEVILMREDEGARHAASLKALLRILESGGWLADFFSPGLLEFWAKKTPTPLAVMEQLTEPAFNFESTIDEAKQMMRDWPELFPGKTEPVEPREANEKARAASPSRDGTGYVLNEFDSTGNLARAIWMSRDQYRKVKKTLLEQGCEVVDENGQAKAPAK